MAIPWPTTGGAVATSLKWGTERVPDLEDFAAVAVSKIEDKVGPWHGQTLTHTAVLRASSGTIILPWPVALVESLTRDGVAVAWDTASLSGTIYGAFPAGTYTVTATARSAASCPPEIALAARKLAAHLAKQELVGPRQTGFTAGPDKDVDVQQGFALPRAVSELIADHVLVGAFA